MRGGRGDLLAGKRSNFRSADFEKIRTFLFCSEQTWSIQFQLDFSCFLLICNSSLKWSTTHKWISSQSNEPQRYFRLWNWTCWTWIKWSINTNNGDRIIIKNCQFWTLNLYRSMHKWINNVWSIDEEFQWVPRIIIIYMKRLYGQLATQCSSHSTHTHTHTHNFSTPYWHKLCIFVELENSNIDIFISSRVCQKTTIFFSKNSKKATATHCQCP